MNDPNKININYDSVIRNRHVHIPSPRELDDMEQDNDIQATDGCHIDSPYGTCPHGFPSWLAQFGKF